MERIVSFTTQKGGDGIAFRGYSYHYDRLYQKSGKIDWRCSKRECRGRLQTSTTKTEPVEKGQHTDYPSEDEINAKVAEMKMRTRCKEEPTSIPVIYKREVTKAGNQGNQ